MAKVGKEKAVKEQPEKEFKPEVVEPGVYKDEKKETPMDKVESFVPVKTKGNWVKVTPEKLAEYEQKGLLLGYDPDNGEALLSQGDTKK